jgi:hypothetical protein
MTKKPVLISFCSKLRGVASDPSRKYHRLVDLATVPEKE